MSKSQQLSSSSSNVEAFIAQLFAQIPFAEIGSSVAAPRFAAIFKGPQTAGVPISFRVVQHSRLVSAWGSDTFMLLRAALPWTSVPSASISQLTQMIAMIVCANTGSVFPRLNTEVFPNDTLYVDSIGGLGANDWAILMFELITNAHVGIAS